MEYAVPLADGPSIVKEIRQLIDNRGWHFGFPIEMRTTAADDVALSTAYGRESMYIAVHVPQFQDPWEFFPDIEAIFRTGARCTLCNATTWRSFIRALMTFAPYGSNSTRSGD